MTSERETVRRLGEADAAGVIDVLSESFFDYPVMRFVLDRSSAEYERHLRTLIRFFVMARVLRRETLLGIGERPDGAALVSRPHGPAGPRELDDLRERVWAEVGPAAREKYEAFGRACARFGIEVPHLHLNMVGVRRDAQGKGLGRLLIEHVHRLSREDPESRGVTLSTEDARNVPLYERLGYRIVGHAKVAPELETWCFFRPDRS